MEGGLDGRCDLIDPSRKQQSQKMGQADAAISSLDKGQEKYENETFVEQEARKPSRKKVTLGAESLFHQY